MEQLNFKAGTKPKSDNTNIVASISDLSSTVQTYLPRLMLAFT